MNPAEIVGSWRLSSWAQEYDDGRRVLPMGETPQGLITYTADGHMSVVITGSDRPSFRTGGQWDADVAERAGAYDTCLAYAGRYEVDGDQIQHHVEISLFPDWVGHTQVRQADLSNGQLHLTARAEEGTPQARTARLSWQRTA